jgi:cyclohexyl-isocyanide hydratase
VPEGPPEQIALLIYPKFTALDLIGPHTFLAALGNVKVHLVWKSLEPVTSDNGLRVHPNATFNDCPQDLTILFVPGGLKGTIELMNDTEVLDFLRDRGARAKYVTSVCTGSLVLGAAGPAERV